MGISARGPSNNTFLGSVVVRNAGDTADVVSLTTAGAVEGVTLRATAPSSKAFYTDGEHWTLHTALRADNPSGGGMLQIGSTVAPTTDEQLVKFIYGACTSTTSTRLWDMGKDSTTMTLAGNAGADFVIRNYTDAGALISTPFKIRRSNGAVMIGGGSNPTFHASSNASASAVPKQEVYGDVSAGGEVVQVIRGAVNSSAVARNVGIALKMSTEVDATESNKAWTITAYSAVAYASAPSLVIRSGYLNKNSLTVDGTSGVITLDGTVVTPATVAGAAGLRLPHGTAPSSPVNGDVWTTTAGMYVRVNGTTIGPLNTNGPATTVTTLTGLQSAVVGTSTLYARQDHQHAVAGVVDTSTTQSSVGGAKTFTSLLTASAGVTVTGAKTTVAATAAGYASLNYPSGTAPSTPAAGDTWATSAGFYRSVGVASNTTRIPGTLNFSHCSSDSSAATTGTYVVPTGFPATIPVKSGRTYRVEVVGFYQCAATTYAPRHRLQYPTLTAGSITMDSFSAASTNTQTGSAVTLGASSQTFVSAAAGAANTSYLFRLDGFIIPSADGNLIYDFTPNAAGTMRIMADTFISVTEVG